MEMLKFAVKAYIWILKNFDIMAVISGILFIICSLNGSMTITPSAGVPLGVVCAVVGVLVRIWRIRRKKEAE